MPVLLQTDRMILRTLQSDDLENLYQLDSDKSVMKYIGPVRSKTEVIETLKKVIAYYSFKPGFGAWAAISKTSNKFSGWFCLKNLDKSENIEVGYRLMKNAWGLGYATEGTRALLQYGFSILQLSEIVAITNPGHTASQHVLQKCGLKFTGQEFYYNTNVNYYIISKIDYENI